MQQVNIQSKNTIISQLDTKLEDAPKPIICERIYSSKAFSDIFPFPDQ